jgi:tetratricopeptide (TPR) repeat protein
MLWIRCSVVVMNEATQRLARRLTGLAARRSGFAVGLWGEPGIGKTHMALALLRGTPCQSFTVHATQTPEAIALVLPRPKKTSIWLEQALDRLRRGESSEPGALLQTVTTLMSANSPLILHVEDLHEAEPERLEFWKQLSLAVVRIRGVGLIVTGRTRPPESIETIQLVPLNREASDALLEAEAGARLPREALDWIFEHALGNPLFTLEFFRFLARRGFLWNDAHRWRWRVPEREVMPVTLEALIEGQLRAALRTTVLEETLKAKAVLGLGVSDESWIEVTQLSPEVFQAARSELEQQGLISAGEFVHPLYREVLLHNLPSAQHQTFARRAINVLEDDPQQASQFLTAAGLEIGEVLVWLERAARAAREAGNQVQAARFQARAVQHAMGEERARLALEAADELYEYDLAETIRLLEIALDVQPQDFVVLGMLASYLAQAGRRSEALRLLEQRLSEDRVNLRGFMLELKVRHYLQDSSQVIDLWNARPELHAQVSPETIRNVAYAKAELGEGLAALELVQRALNQPDLNQPDLEINERVLLLEACGFACYTRSDYVHAERFYSEAIELFRHHGQAHRTGSLLFNRSIVYQGLARFLPAIADAEESLELALKGGHARFYANAQFVLGGARLELGEYELAEELMLEALDYYRQTGLKGWQVDVELKLSELYRQWSSPQAGVLAQRHAESALFLARTLNNPRYVACVLPCAALSEASFGRPQRALGLAEEGYALVSTQDDATSLYQILWARAVALDLLGRSSQALADFRQAQSLAEGTGAILDAHKIGLEIDRLNSDATSAQKRVRWFEEHGLRNAENIARRYFPDAQNHHSRGSRFEAKSDFQLEVLGPMQLRFEGKITPLRGGKRKELLMVLLEARITGKREVSRLDLMDAFYPNTIEAQANAALTDVVYQLRELCGSNAILTTEGGYALGQVGSDAEDFLETGETRLWRGAYLDGDHGGETVRETLQLALRVRAEALLETDPIEAARLGRLLSQADPYDLEYLRLTLRALRAGANHKSLTRAYEKARMNLLEIGETLPERWTDFLEAPIGANA